MEGPCFLFPDFEVGVDYGAQGPVIRDGQETTIKLTIRMHARAAFTRYAEGRSRERLAISGFKHTIESH